MKSFCFTEFHVSKLPTPRDALEGEGIPRILWDKPAMATLSRSPTPFPRKNVPSVFVSQILPLLNPLMMDVMEMWWSPTVALQMCQPK